MSRDPKQHPVPPRWATWLVERYSPTTLREVATGDLEERFHRLCDRRSRLWAQGDYIREALLFCLWHARHREPSYDQARGPIMWKNYLTVALRTMRRQKGYTVINVGGLALGLACCVLILLYIQDELRYDRYHENADRIYRFVEQPIAKVGASWGPMLETALPEVEATVRFFHYDSDQSLVQYGTQRFYERDIVYADAAVLQVFSWPLRQGNPETALAAPYSLVLTEVMAEKYFGDEDPLGKVLLLDNDQSYQVTGILEPLPRQSHFTFDFLASFATIEALDAEGRWGAPLSWTNSIFFTYLLFAPSHDIAATEAKLPALVERFVGVDRSVVDPVDLGFQPLTDIYLRSSLRQEIAPMGSITYIYILGAVALFVLLIACINFMNLTTARSQGRAREVGVRKVLGAHRRQLVQQFFSESLLVSILAFGLGLLLTVGLTPIFNALSGKELTLVGAAGIGGWLALLGVVLFVGLLAGSYPALYLSAFRPAVVVKGAAAQGLRSTLLRKGLVVFQFTASITLMIGTVLVFQQLQYVQQKNLGYHTEQVVVIPLASDDGLRAQIEAAKAEVLTHPGVLAATASHSLPGQFLNGFSYRHAGADAEERVGLSDLVVDLDFIDAYGMTLVAGRGFSKDLPTDSTTFVLNAAAVTRLGWASPEEALGQEIEWMLGDAGYTGPVIGVVQDFHYRTLHTSIPPMVLHLTNWSKNFLSVHIRPESTGETLAFLETVWARFEPGFPFSYYFLDADFAARYENEQRLGQIFVVFTALALLIACLGLFGLAAFTAERRSKEIGVRKVFGASVPGLVGLLSRDFLQLVGLGFVLSVPVAYLVMDRWLANFAYHIDLGWGVFVVTGGAALLIAWLTVSYQSVRVARRNPAETLHYE